jgi:predicted neuraminidase
MRNVKTVQLLALLMFVTAIIRGTAAQPGLLKSGFIYETAPFPQCHASTISEAGKGDLVAAWFGGTRERHPDVGIWMARNSGGKWSPPEEVANGIQEGGDRVPCWNPVLFRPVADEATLWLFYKAGPSPSAWWGMIMTSADSGRTWSKPRRLTEGMLGPIKNKPVRLAGGDILCPSSSEQDGWRVHFERTSGGGRKWSATPPVNDKTIDAIQPSILLHPGGRLQALGRTRQGKLFETWSDDAGRTWSRMTLMELPNPNSGTDAVTLADGRHVLVYNHNNALKNGRSPLNLAISGDGKHWLAAMILENEPGAEFSYPAVIQTSDGLVHVTYTWKRQRIKHAVIDPAQLSLRPIVGSEWPDA